MQDIRDFPSTGDRLDEPNCFVVSLTNPFQITGLYVVTLEATGGQTFNNDYNYNYRLNSQLQPAASGTTYGNLTEFRY